ncbi:MAG: DUF3572 family protein [Pseudomonadota bacterium]
MTRAGRTEPTREREQAQAVALQALAFLLDDDHRAKRFLAWTGIETIRLREAAHDPAALGGVLDYLLAHENLLLAFAAWAGLEPASVAPARRRLPGA